MSPTLTRGFNRTEQIVAKTMEYLAFPSVVGHERFFIDHLVKDFESLDLTVTRHDGLLEISGNKPNSAIICAHVDRHGLISIGGNKYAYAAQYIREFKYNEEHQSSRKELMNIADRFEGERIYAYDPETGIKTGDGIIRPSLKAMENGDSVFLVEGMEEQPPGTPLAYARMAKARDGLFKGQIDNTLSLGVVHALYKAGYQGTALLTTEEEIGKSWIHISNHLEKQKIETRDLIVMDTSPYLEREVLEDGCVVLRTRDRFGPFNTDLVERFKARCATLGIQYEVKDELMLAQGKTTDELGSTELGRLIKEKENRWSGATVQIPTIMYHTSSETTTYAAIKQYFRFMKDILIKDPIEFDIEIGKAQNAKNKEKETA